MDFYHYTPSLDAAVVVAVLYTLAAVGTTLQFFRYRSWVWSVMLVGAGSKFLRIEFYCNTTSPVHGLGSDYH